MPLSLQGKSANRIHLSLWDFVPRNSEIQRQVEETDNIAITMEKWQQSISLVMSMSFKGKSSTMLKNYEIICFLGI